MDKKTAGICPCCNSTNTVLKSSEFNSGTYLDSMTCEDCDSSWSENFSYTSFSIIENKKA